MKVVVLRRGPQWRSHAIKAVYYFHRVARDHGSHAVWLPQTGLLVTTDPGEQGHDFPYETWQAEAVRQATV